jgi:predicted AlkP superfamily pyrophosphatase or phosphodiesterase
LINKLNRIIYCIIDCVRAEHFFDFIHRGLMPNFKKVMENGIFSKNCITDFPSVTQPTQISMITGTYTGDFRKELCHGIPLTNWMDRSYSPPQLRCYGANDFQIYSRND